MSHDEIRAWYRTLGPTPAAQMATVQNLLSHSTGDCMSGADCAVCRQAITMLYAELTDEAQRQHRRTAA